METIKMGETEIVKVDDDFAFKKGAITLKLATEIMDRIACLMLCGTGDLDEDVIRESFVELCDKFGIEEVVEEEEE